MKKIASIGITILLAILCFLTATSCTDTRGKLSAKEAQIARFYNEFTCESSRHPADSALAQWLMTDSTTLSYSFPTLTADYGILRTASEDGKAAIFSWATGYYSYRTIIQIKDENGFHAIDKGLIQLASDKAGEGYEDGSLTTQVHSLEAANGETFYLTHSFGNPTSSYSSFLHQWAVFKIADGQFVPLKDIFKGEKTTASQLQYHFHLNYWTALTQPAATLDTWKLYQDKGMLWIPVLDEEECLTDRYYTYHFDGTCFIKDKVERGNPFINEKLQDYKCLVQLYKAEDLFARIDYMEDGSYRYASWRDWNMKDGVLDMTLEPDIILKGIYDLNSHTYRFKNGNYSYNVPQMRYEGGRIIHAYPMHPEITVTYNGNPHVKFVIDEY